MLKSYPLCRINPVLLRDCPFLLEYIRSLVARSGRGTEIVRQFLRMTENFIRVEPLSVQLDKWFLLIRCIGRSARLCLYQSKLNQN